MGPPDGLRAHIAMGSEVPGGVPNAPTAHGRHQKGDPPPPPHLCVCFFKTNMFRSPLKNVLPQLTNIRKHFQGSRVKGHVTLLCLYFCTQSMEFPFVLPSAARVLGCSHQYAKTLWESGSLQTELRKVATIPNHEDEMLITRFLHEIPQGSSVCCLPLNQFMAFQSFCTANSPPCSPPSSPSGSPCWSSSSDGAKRRKHHTSCFS